MYRFKCYLVHFDLEFEKMVFSFKEIGTHLYFRISKNGFEDNKFI